jgi:hypothetical protein
VNDQKTWNLGLRSVEKLMSELSPSNRLQLRELLAVYRREKEQMAAVIHRIDAGAICGDCAGQCCLNGKYRMNVLDAVSQFDTGTTVTPDFQQKPLCPYGTERGCLMKPDLRPVDCIQFICDSIDGLLQDAEKSVLLTREKNLQDCLRSTSRLLGIAADTPLLLWAEKISI